MNLHMAQDLKGLIHSLNSHDNKECAEAAKSISSLAKKGTSDVASIKPLISLLFDSNRFVRHNSAFAIGDIAESCGVFDNSALSPLQRLLSDRDDVVRWSADIHENVLRSVLEIAIEISNEGREGKPMGTAFLTGDSSAVLARSKQLVLNPFEGHPHEKRQVTNPEIWENIKEFAQLDGAFVISGDGFIDCAGRYLTADATTYLPGGLGIYTRWN